MRFLILFLISFAAKADFEVIKTDFSSKKIFLNIIRAYPSSWETYTLINQNSREMTLVCSENRVYDNNPLPFIEYRNFYNEAAARFTLPSNEICLNLGRFIEQSHMGIDEESPFLITLSRNNMQVERIIYPNIDPLDDRGDINDLLPKRRTIITYPKTIN
jgi:hypothetical protein